MATLDERVQSVFQEVFDDDDLVVTNASSSSNVENWDSFAQVKLIVAFEEEFDIKFTAEEVAALSNVGDLKASLRAKGVT